MDISGTTLAGDNQLPVFVAVIDDEVDLAYLLKDALSQIDGLMVFNFSDPSLALLLDFVKFFNSICQS